jgi:cytoskeletal protein CcmA (bactofilin family)
MTALLRAGATGAGESWQEVRVSLGADAEVSGRLSFTTATRIEGRLKGEIRSVDLLVVGPQAQVHASVHAQVLIVLGHIEGNVVCTERLEIRSGGHLLGDVATPALVIAEGAFFEGLCQMETAAAAEQAPSPDYS